VFFVAGTYDYGRVDEFQQTSIVTRFVHVWFVPLWPTCSIVKSSLRAPFVVPVVRRSIVAGYGRVWGPLLVAGALVAFACNETLLGVVAAALGIATSIAAWLVGRLDARAFVERRAYRRAIGLPVDPAVLTVADRDRWCAHLLDGLGAKHGDYRGATQVSWQRLAKNAGLDVDTQASLIALARIHETITIGDERRELRALRETLVDALPKGGW
jgi:hypothetical protein